MDLSKMSPSAPEPSLQGINPANKDPVQLSKEQIREKRIPFSSAKRKLETPEIPGFYLYWFLESNVPQALQAAYQFVTPDEACINQNNFSTNIKADGNTDLGNRVSILTKGPEGPERIYLMKLDLEFHHEDQRSLWESNKQRLEAIFKASPYWDNGQELYRPQVFGDPDKGEMVQNRDPNVYMRSKPVLNQRASRAPQTRVPLFNR